jgi:hypothetical protein
MPDRIDFALEPGVILFTALFVILLVVLIGTVAYPYLRSDTSEAEGAEEPEAFIDDTPTDPEILKKRVDNFVKEMEGG